MDRLLFIIAVLSFQFVYARIKIKELTMPASIEYTGDSSSEIILDCNYDAEEEEVNELEVIWYHNSDRNPIYQWIPFSNRSGDARGLFKDHVDLEYTVSDDKKMMYRALKLKNITTDLTGNYTCRVSSSRDEDDETKQLVVYSPAKAGIELMVDEETKEVICTVEGVFPVPRMDIYITGENGTKIDLKENSEVTIDEDGYYSVNTTHHFKNGTWLSDISDPVRFVCSLSIPGTNYSLKESVDYYIAELEEYYFIVNDYDGFNLTEESFNTTEDSNGAPVYCPTVYLSTALLLLLLLVGK